MPRGSLALFLFLIAAGSSFAQPPSASSPAPPGPVRCPALADAPRLTDDANRHERAIRYLLLIERYCRGPMEAALADIDAFALYEFRDRRDELEGYRANLRLERLIRANLDGQDWFIRVVRTASMLHLDRALRSPPHDSLHASHLNWSRQLMRLLEGVEEDPSFRHDWYIAVGALLHGQVLFRELDAHLREARDAFPESARLALAWGMMREAQASPRILPLLMADHMAKVFATERPDPQRWLEDAERSYGRALDLDPGFEEARLRRGQVLVTLKRPDPGYADLLVVRDAASRDRRLGYLASLFAGAVLERNDRVPEAVESYRTAADLYPECQTASFALSHAFRKAGSRDEAARLVQVALDRGANETCLDPIWIYDLGWGPQSDDLIDGLRRRVRQ